MNDFEEATIIIDRDKGTCEILCPHCLTWMHESFKYDTVLIRRCPLCLEYFEVDYGTE